MTARKGMGLEERFHAQHVPVPESGCWLWSGAITNHGYGVIRANTRSTYAHRVSYELHVGPIADGMTIDHLCSVRACVNPNHLKQATQRENILRSDSVAARKSRQTHCVHGHEFTTANTIVTLRHGNFGRSCRLCKQRKDRVAYAKARAQGVTP